MDALDGYVNSDVVVLVLSISNASFSANQASIKRMTIDNMEFDVDKSAEWDMNNTGFYYQLFLELWTFDPPSNSVQFENRFVGIHLNLTTTTA